MITPRGVLPLATGAWLLASPAAHAAPRPAVPRLVAQFNVHGTIVGMAVDPDAYGVTYQIVNNEVEHLDTRTGRRDTLRVFRVPPRIPRPEAFPPSPDLAASARGDWIAAASSESIFVLDRRSGRVLRAVRAYATGSLAASPVGDRVAGCQQGSPGFAIWDVATGRLLGRWGTESGGGFLAWSPRDEIVAFAPLGHAATLWDTRNGRRLGVLPGEAKWTMGMCFSPDGRRLVAAHTGGTVVAWDVRTCRVIWRAPVAPETGVNVDFSPDGRFVLGTIPPGELFLLDAARGGLVCRWRDEPQDVVIAHFSPALDYVASAGIRGNLRVWDVRAVLAARRSGGFAGGASRR